MEDSFGNIYDKPTNENLNEYSLHPLATYRCAVKFGRIKPNFFIEAHINGKTVAKEVLIAQYKKITIELARQYNEDCYNLFNTPVIEIAETQKEVGYVK